MNHAYNNQRTIEVSGRFDDCYTPLALIVVLPAILFLSQNSKAVLTNDNSGDAALVHLYTKLFYSRVVVDASKCTLVLQKLDSGDVQTAKRILQIWLESDMHVIDSQTNHVWSKDEKEGIDRAREYLKLAH